MMKHQWYPPSIKAPSKAAIEETAQKNYKKRSQTEKARGLVEKNFQRMGALEAARLDQAARHHDLGGNRTNLMAPTPMDYSKGIFARDLLSGTLQLRR